MSERLGDVLGPLRSVHCTDLLSAVEISEGGVLAFEGGVEIDEGSAHEQER